MSLQIEDAKDVSPDKDSAREAIYDVEQGATGREDKHETADEYPNANETRSFAFTEDLGNYYVQVLSKGDAVPMGVKI